MRVQDIDFLRQQLHVRQQIRVEGNQLRPALPKYEKVRSVPLPQVAIDALAVHTLNWTPLAGERLLEPGLGGLLFYGREKKPINRNYFNPLVWKPALRAAAVTPSRENGMHALRHTCASTWLEHGVSIRAVSEYLGHSDPGFTLRVYTHVMPTSAAKARQAVDDAFGEARRVTEGESTTGAFVSHGSTAGAEN